MSLATASRSKMQPMPLVDLNRRERSRYSISRAIITAASIARGREAQSFELDVSQTIDRQLPASIKRHGGVWVPTVLTRSGLDSKTSTKGQEMVFASPGSFIDALRNRAVVLSLGATMLTGLRDNIAFPRQTAPGAASWVPENPGSDVADADLTLDRVVTAGPKTLEGSTSFSRQLLVQGTPNIDQLVTNDLAQVNAVALDLAAIHGAGGDEPVGIYNLSGVNPVAMGGALTFAKVVDLESQIGINNAETDPASMGYITTPEIRARGKQIPELAGGSIRIWRNGQMNDHPAEATNQVSKTLGAGSEHGIVFGVWSELLFLEWGAAELVVDPFRLLKRGMIEVTSFLLANLAFRHAQSFSKGTGLTTA